MLFRNTVDVVFSKNVSVEKIIRSRTYDSVKAEHDLWLQTARDKHLISELECHNSTPLLSPVKEKTREQIKTVSNDNKNQAVDEHSQQHISQIKGNAQPNKGLKLVILILILLIIFLMISVIVLYSKLNTLEEKFNILERTWRRSVFDDSHGF